MKYKTQINNRGQILLVVMLVGMIALIITMGMVSRVSRLTKSVVETEEHEAAYSTSEKYSRKILEVFDQGIVLDQAGVESLIDLDDNVSITVSGVPSITGVFLAQSETYEVAVSSPAAGSSLVLSMEDDRNIDHLLVSVISYNGTEYSTQKRLFVTCALTDGDLAASCDPNNQSVTYTFSGTEVSVRYKFLADDARFSVNFNGGVIANEYTITTTEEIGEESGVQSETKLYVPLTKAMPSVFDYVLFNGTGTLSK